MDVHEAIDHCEQIIKDKETCDGCRQEHMQLKEWLTICAAVLDNIKSYGIGKSNDGGVCVEMTLKAASASDAIKLKNMVMPTVSNKERVLDYCRNMQSSSTESLMSRDDVELRVKKYPEDKKDWFEGCPGNYGLSEYEDDGLCCRPGFDKEKFHTGLGGLEICRECWLKALEGDL